MLVRWAWRSFEMNPYLFSFHLLLAAGAEDHRGRQLLSITEEHQEDTDLDPWTPCQKTRSEGIVYGFCRLSCTARWSYAPERMDCEILPKAELLARSHSAGMKTYRAMSSDSFSKVNSGFSTDPNDPDI